MNENILPQSFHLGHAPHLQRLRRRGGGGNASVNSTPDPIPDQGDPDVRFVADKDKQYRANSTVRHWMAMTCFVPDARFPRRPDPAKVSRLAPNEVNRLSLPMGRWVNFKKEL